MPRVEAIAALIREGRTEVSWTVTAANRVLKACQRIDLTRDETILIFAELDYCDTGGKPWRDDLPRVWDAPNIFR